MARPPKYKTAKELQEKIDEYFEKGHNKRKVVVGRGATKTVVELPIYTITGLVLYCGFCDRHSFYDYEKKEEFTHTIKAARTRIENIYEEGVQIASNPAGFIFGLKNFGWVDTQEVSNDTEMTIKIVNE